MDGSDAQLGAAKRQMRAEMRALRRALPDRPARSARIWANLQQLPQVAEAGVVMAFNSVPGEPETSALIEWCRGAGKSVVFPEDDPSPNPQLIDVVIVPGTAFTADGCRLGQGGGWYDRFLPQLRVDCLTVGVCFDAQRVTAIPVEPHDVCVDLVATESEITGR